MTADGIVYSDLHVVLESGDINLIGEAMCSMLYCVDCKLVEKCASSHHITSTLHGLNTMTMTKHHLLPTDIDQLYTVKIIRQQFSTDRTLPCHYIHNKYYF